MEVVQAALAKPYLVISRALLHFVCLTLGSIPNGRVEAAIRLQIMPLSPYPKFGFAWQRQAENYSIYFWDAEKIERNMAEQGMAAHEAIPIPEPFLKAAPESGTFLTCCLEGYEAVYRVSSQTMASRWWKYLPEENECLSFVRDSGQQGIAPPRHPITLGWLEKPPNDVSLQRNSSKISISEPFIIQTLIMLIGLAIALIGVRHIKLESAIRERHTEIASLTPLVADTIKLRQEAENDATLSTRLMANEDNGEALAIMANLVRTGIGEKSGIILRDFELRSGKLRFSLTSSKGNIPRTQFLERLAAIPGFANVRLLSDNDSQAVSIETDITSPFPIFIPPRETPQLLVQSEQKPRIGGAP